MQRKWQVLIVVSVGVFMSSLDLFIVNIAFPDVAADFEGTSLASLSWILSAYAVVYAALMVPAGRWADALGRRRVFLAGLGGFVLASAACAAAPSVELLIAARVLQAAAAALMLPTSLGLLLPEFPSEERRMAIAIWAAMGALAAAAGPPLGGLLVEADWRWVFIVNVPLGIAALVAGARILREIRDPDTARPDAPAAVALAGGIGALVVAISQAGTWGWTSAEVLGLTALAIVLLAAVARRCARHPVPVVEPAMLRVPAFSGAVIASVLFFAAFATMLLGSVLYLTTVWDEPVLTAGLMLAPGPVMAATFAVPSARLVDRFGARAVGASGTLLFAAAGTWWLTRLGSDPAFASESLPGGLLSGLGVALVIPTLTGAAAASLPAERFATGAAVVTMGRQLGSALGVALLVAVLGPTPDAAAFDGAWILLIATALAAGAVFFVLGPRRAPVPAAAVSTVPTGAAA